MQCIICGKKLAQGEIPCPVCGANQTEEVLARAAGNYVKGKMNLYPCRIAVTANRLVAVDDYAATGANGGAGGGLLGAAIGAGIGKALDKKFKKCLVDISLATVAGVKGEKGTLMFPMQTCTITTISGEEIVFKVDKNSKLVEELQKLTGAAQPQG